jgi:hypothetical protein
MENDIQRIEVGGGAHRLSSKNIKAPEIPFDFSSEEITFDDPGRTFDETKYKK